MKYLLTLLSLILFNFSFAQFDVFKVGAGLCYGTEIEQPGIVLKGNTNLTEVIDGSVSINYFLPNKFDQFNGEVKWTWWSINFDGHYLFPINDKTIAYGLAGLNIVSVKVSSDYEYLGQTFGGSASDTDIGINIGGGAELVLTDNLTGFSELKYTLSGADQLVISIGALIDIGKSE